jgi:hypothetical protein
MQRLYRHIRLANRQACAAAVMLAAALVGWLSLYATPAGAAPTSDLVNAAVVLPGTTRTIKVVQLGRFPFGCPQFFILVLGRGTLGISLRNDSSAAETFFMLGVARSGDSATPIARIGSSPGLAAQMIEIEDSPRPGALVWLACGVAFADKDPAYLYDLRLSLAP